MNMHKQVITLASFTFAFSGAYAMDNNRPKPPTAINFTGTFKPIEFKSGTFKPAQFKSTINFNGTFKPAENKSIINGQGNSPARSEVVTQPVLATHNVSPASKPSATNLDQAKLNSDKLLANAEQNRRSAQQAIDQFSLTTSKNNSQAAELVTAVFEKLSHGKKLTDDEKQTLQARLHALKLNSQQAADEAKKALNFKEEESSNF